MHLIIRHLFLRLKEANLLEKLNAGLREELETAFLRTSFEISSKALDSELKRHSLRNRTRRSTAGQSHAFSRHNGTHYNAAAAALANGRTSEFLHQQLR
jgi:dienelactone hydrolase